MDANAFAQPIDISLVIPAYNGAAYLPRLLDTVEVAGGRYRHGAERIEVIVADNCSTDETARIAQARGCTVQQVSRRLIAAARNGGAAVARGELIAFADTDFRIHPETFNYIASLMQHPDIIGGATGLTMERWSLGIAATYGLVVIPLLFSGFDGGVYFCRRSDFVESKGFYEAVSFGEDIGFMKRMKRLGASRQPQQRFATRRTGRRLGLEPPLVLNSTRKYDKHGDWHTLGDIVKGIFCFVFARHRIEEYARRYWYEDRA